MKTLRFEITLEVEDDGTPAQLADALQHAMMYLVDRNELDGVAYSHKVEYSGTTGGMSIPTTSD